MTINTKFDALLAIDAIADKLIKKKINFKNHGVSEIKIMHDSVVGWNGTGPAPRFAAALAADRGITELAAKARIITLYETTVAVFETSIELELPARKEIKALANPTPAQLKAVYDKHEALFMSEW